MKYIEQPVWTDEKPKVPGKYWRREKQSCGNCWGEAMLVELEKIPKGARRYPDAKGALGRQYAMNYEVYWDANLDGQWSHPVVLPEESE